MTWSEIIILAVVCLAFVSAIALIVISKLKHNGGCDCGGSCSQCCGCCPHCVPAKSEENDKSKRRN